jgi:hypothetical protein
MNNPRKNNEPAKWLGFVHLCDALAAEGCPICTLLEKACYRQLDSLFYECVNDPGVRNRLAASHGFCNWHAHLALRIPHTDSGIAIIYEDLLRAATEQPLRRPSASCPVCDTARFNERVYLGELLRHFDDPELRPRYEQSFGLCLPHLQQAAHEYPGHDKLPALLAAERKKLAALRAELQEFNRKRDYRFANEPKGAEQTAWRRVIEKFTGKRELFGRAPPPP